MNKSPSREDTIEEKSQEDIQRQSSNDKNDDLQLKEKLKESELRYRRLFESAKDGILILDFENGNIIDANPYIVNMIDLPLVEILGKKLWEIGLFSNKEESELAFTELKTNGYIRFEDMPVLKRNGKIKEVEFISNVYPTGNSKLIQCNIRDITERVKADFQLKENIDQIKRVNNELILAKNKAEESDKLKSSFLANMSHEIRTPMNAIIGFSEFLLDPELSKDKLEKYVHIIVASSQQLLTIINDIIDISKIESGQLYIGSELVNVNKLMDEIFVSYKKLVDLKKLKLICQVSNPDKLIQVKTDGSRIRQVICNLLNNAIKFTKEGEISFGYTIQENFIEFYVEDSGIGIAPENLSLIFKRFRQENAPNKQLNEGNGLGLSISEALVEKLGGTISVDSTPGIGSRFVFTIPYKNEIPNAMVTTSDTEQQYNWDDKTILIAEDEAINYYYINELLSVTNAKTLHAWDGKQAVELVKNHPDISLVLMDLKMPVMDGNEAMRLIKQIEPELTVIAQTAYANSDSRKKAIKGGFDNYITKPIDSILFMEVINSYLSKSSTHEK